MNVLKHSKSEDLSESPVVRDMTGEQKIGGRSRGSTTTEKQIVNEGHLDDYFLITQGV